MQQTQPLRMNEALNFLGGSFNNRDNIRIPISLQGKDKHDER